MHYDRNAKNILPENILIQLQTYAAGTLLYVPKEGEEKSWGEVSGYRTYPLFEALTRIRRESYPVIIWTTQRTDYEAFSEKYGDFE